MLARKIGADSKMAVMKTISPEVAAIILIGFLMVFFGIYLNFQNLDRVMYKVVDRDKEYPAIKGDEAIYGLIQLSGMVVIFLGLSRGMLRRTDMMTGKFVNIMDVFSSLIKREMDTMDDRSKREKLRELGSEGERFKSELRGRRI
jgi:hypothetical protein